MSVSRFRPIFQALNDAGVSYVVVGGIATNLLGHIRNTLDVDLIVAFEPDNLDRLAKSMEALGFVPRMPVDPRGLANEQTRKEWQTRNMVVYAFVKATGRPVLVDVFIDHPIPYPDLLSRSAMLDLDGEKVRVCSLDDLFFLKNLAARPQDLDDIEQLKAANEHSG